MVKNLTCQILELAFNLGTAVRDTQLYVFFSFYWHDLVKNIDISKLRVAVSKMRFFFTLLEYIVMYSISGN